MKNMYVYICVAVMSCVTVMPAHEAAAPSRNQSPTDWGFVAKQQLAVGGIFLVVGIVLEALYGSKHKEFTGLNAKSQQQQFDCSDSKKLKKQMRKIKLKRAGYIMLKAFAAICCLTGGFIALKGFLNSFRTSSRVRGRFPNTPPAMPLAPEAPASPGFLLNLSEDTKRFMALAEEEQRRQREAPGYIKVPGWRSKQTPDPKSFSGGNRCLGATDEFLASETSQAKRLRLEAAARARLQSAGAAEGSNIH